MNVRSFPEEAHSNKIIVITSLVSGLTIKARVAICFSTCFIFICSKSRCSPHKSQTEASIFTTYPPRFLKVLFLIITITIQFPF